MDESILLNVVSASKLERDRSIEFLTVKLEKGSTDAHLLLEKLEDLVTNNNFWEAQLGCLQAAYSLLAHLDEVSMPQYSFWSKIVVANLDNEESRVRKAAAVLAGLLVKQMGMDAFLFFRNLAISKLKIFMTRDTSSGTTDVNQSVAEQQMQVDQEVTNNQKEMGGGKTSEQVLHDTAGWRALESYMACLQEVMTNSATLKQSDAKHGLDDDLMLLICESCEHKNRFVREMSYHVIGSIISLLDFNCPSNLQVAHNLCTLIVKGLSDNWSQVRMSASNVARTFCLSVKSDTRKQFYPKILPPMCLNRYYIAEGVRLYSQETWKLVLGENGKEFVGEYIDHIVEFYVDQSEAENHAVREAACSCITELVTKIDKSVLQKHIDTLLDVLLTCFDDDSWPVRDSACVATGFFVEAFPTECESCKEEILHNLYGNLRDNIGSVREGAATALRRFVSVYSDSHDSIFAQINEGLKAVADQPEMSVLNESLDKGVATYSVVKQLHDNDVSLHENQIMYSCGSLAPKMKRGSRNKKRNSKSTENGDAQNEEVVSKPRDTGGCSAHSFRRPGQPWETTDGFVLLLGELSSIEQVKSRFDQKLILLFEKVFHYRHFTHHAKLFTTGYNVLSILFTNLGKMFTKRCVEIFLDCLFYGLTIDNKLAQCAAQDCFIAISKIIGPNILKGRVENYDPKQSHKLDFLQ